MTTTTRPARKRGKQPDPLDPIRGLVRNWQAFAQGRDHPIFREVLARMSTKERATFDEMLRVIPDPHSIPLMPECPTCHQGIRGDERYLILFGQILDQVKITTTERTATP